MAEALPLPAPFVDDAGCRANWDTLKKLWPSVGLTASRSQLLPVTAAATLDVSVDSAANMALIEFDLETSVYCELHMFPNALATAIYSYIRDGSTESFLPAAVAVAAAGVARDVNGIRLALPPSMGAANGTQMTGSALFGLRVPSTANRSCIAKTAILSITGASNHAIELQNIASRVETLAAVTSLRFAVSAGTMTGYIRVTTT